MAGLDRQGRCKVGLSGTRRPQEDHVFFFVHEVQIEEAHDRPLVQVLVEAEVILLDGLGKRQSCDLERGFDPPLLFGRHLFLQQAVRGAMAS